jgi:hypothetical protein
MARGLVQVPLKIHLPLPAVGFALPAFRRAAQTLIGLFWLATSILKCIHGEPAPGSAWSIALHVAAVALEAALGLSLLFDLRPFAVRLAILWPLALFVYAFVAEQMAPAGECGCLGAGRVEFGWRCVLLGALLLLAAAAAGPARCHIDAGGER